MLTPPSHEQETHVLEGAMKECGRLLKDARAHRDDLAADLLQSDLNTMLERWAELHGE